MWGWGSYKKVTNFGFLVASKLSPYIDKQITKNIEPEEVARNMNYP